MKTAKPFWLTRVAVVGLVLSFLAACEDTTEPDFQLDPEGTEAAMEGVVADFFENNEAATSLMYLGESISQALGGGGPRLNASPPAEGATLPTVEWFRRQAGEVTTRDVGPGSHYLTEDQPDAIGRAVADWIRGL